LGAPIPSLARCGLDENTLLILRVRRRLRGPDSTLVELIGPSKPAHPTSVSFFELFFCCFLKFLRYGRRFLSAVVRPLEGLAS
jgi:hypothetical protein